MADYQTLKQELQELYELAEAARQMELAEAKAQIMRLMSEYKITIEEISGVNAPKKIKKPTSPMYRDPETGSTWSGRGRAPRWLRGPKDQYLIN